MTFSSRCRLSPTFLNLEIALFLAIFSVSIDSKGQLSKRSSSNDLPRYDHLGFCPNEQPCWISHNGAAQRQGLLRGSAICTSYFYVHDNLRWNKSQLVYFDMINERSSSPILRKTISEPQTEIESATVKISNCIIKLAGWYN